MANKKFSEFVLKTNTSGVSHIVGYSGSENVQITPTDFITTTGGPYLPLAGGTMTGPLVVDSTALVSDILTAGLGLAVTGGTVGSGKLVLASTNKVHLSGGSAGLFLDNNDESSSIELTSTGTLLKHNSNNVARVLQSATSLSNATYTFEVDSASHDSNLSSAGAMAVDVNSGRAFTITGAGNLGVGLSVPATKIHIKGATDTQVRIEAGAASGEASVAFYEGGNRLATMGASNTGEIFTISADSNLTSGMRFSTNDTERMRLNSSGNLGIGGTPTVGYNLDAIRSTNGYTVVGRHTSGGQVGIYNSTGDNGIGTINNFPMNFFTNNSAPQMTLESNGNLRVYDVIDNLQNTLTLNGRNTGEIHFQSGSAEKMRLLANGNVGVGTSIPVGKIHARTSSLNGVSEYQGQNFGLIVETDGQSAQFDDGNGIVFTQDYDAANTTQIRTGAIIGYKGALANSFGGGLKFKVQQFGALPLLTAMTLDMAGNVGIGLGTGGIGSINPTAKLEITGIRENQIRLSSYDTSAAIDEVLGGIDFYSYDTGNEGVKASINVISGDISGNAYMTFKTGANVERMKINSNGKIEFPITLTTGHTASSILHGSNGFLYLSGGAGGTSLGDATQSTRILTYNDDYIRFDTSGSERMRITSAGRLLVGTTSLLGGDDYVTVANGDGGRGGIRIGNNVGSSSTNCMRFNNSNGVVGSIITSGSATAYNTSSDYRLKEDLQDFKGLDMVSKIPVYDYKWKADKSRSYGVMAHELQEVLPQAVSGNKDAEEMQSVDYSKIVPVLVKAIQELKAEIELLKK